MKYIKILGEREIKSIFNSWFIYLGYIMFFLFTGFYCWFSSYNVFLRAQVSMAPVFVIVNWVMFFMVPALTMKSVADEKRRGIMELILTKPVNIYEFLSAKFLSLYIVAIIPLILTIPYLITISSFGKLDYGPVFLGYLTLILICGVYVSIGIFSSSVTRSPVISLFLTYGIFILFQNVFGIIAELLNVKLFIEFFRYLSLTVHLDTMSKGILDTRDLIYLISMMWLFLSFSKYFLNRKRI